MVNPASHTKFLTDPRTTVNRVDASILAVNRLVIPIRAAMSRAQYLDRRSRLQWTSDSATTASDQPSGRQMLASTNADSGISGGGTAAKVRRLISAKSFGPGSGAGVASAVNSASQARLVGHEANAVILAQPMLEPCVEP